jgi:ribonuclease D
LEAVQLGVERSAEGDLSFPSHDGDDLDKSMRPAATLVSAWVTELARQSNLDAGLLGTRKDINDLLSGAPGARMSEGWRADIVGRDIEDLVAGRKALTVTKENSGNGLKLVDVTLV